MPVWLPASELVEVRGRGLLRWLGGAAVLGLGLVRHLAGQSTPEDARVEAGFCAAKHEGHSHADPGAAWAAREEHRHSHPKCC